MTLGTFAAQPSSAARRRSNRCERLFSRSVLVSAGYTRTGSKCRNERTAYSYGAQNRTAGISPRDQMHWGGPFRIRHSARRIVCRPSPATADPPFRPWGLIVYRPAFRPPPGRNPCNLVADTFSPSVLLSRRQITQNPADYACFYHTLLRGLKPASVAQPCHL